MDIVPRRNAHYPVRVELTTGGMQIDENIPWGNADNNKNDYGPASIGHQRFAETLTTEGGGERCK